MGAQTVTRSALAPAAAAATGILVGSAIVATRFVIPETDPISLALLRYTIGFFCLLGPVLLASRGRIARADLLPIALLGIAQFAILLALLNFALQSITSALAAIIFATMPLLTLLLGAALGSERLGLLKALGVILSLGGVAIALAEKAVAPGALSWLGVGCAFASALCGAVCSVFYRRYVRTYPPLLVSAYAMFASVIFLAVLVVAQGHLTHLIAFSRAGWAAVAFLGVNSGVGYFLWLWALAHASATRVTVFLALSPFTAAVLGTFFGEPIGAATFAGLAAVACGLYLALSARE